MSDDPAGTHGSGRSHQDPGDYLWDRSGPSDQEVRALEESLGTFRLRPSAGRPVTSGIEAARRPRLATRRRRLGTLAGVLAVLLVLLAVWSALPRPGSARVARLETGPSGVLIDGSLRQGALDLHPGVVIRTGDRQSARLTGPAPTSWHADLPEASEIVILEPVRGSLGMDLRAGRVIISGSESGTPPVRVWDTTLQLRGAGDCFVGREQGGCAVELKRGQVEAVRGGVRTRILPGFPLQISAEEGPRVPLSYAAPPGFAAAVRKLEGIPAQDPGRADMLSLALASAGAAELPTLWNLASRGTPAERASVVKRAMQLSSLPREIDTGAIIKGDPEAFDRWWEAIVAGREGR